MIFDSLSAFQAASPSSVGKGPFGVLIAEDEVELASSLKHLHSLGFKSIIVVAPENLTVPAPPELSEIPQHILRHSSRKQGTTQQVINALIEKVPGQWIHYCYNGEYLFFPFCEDRSVSELVTWVMEERRASVLTYVIDLYAGDLRSHPNAVDLDGALLDSSGYYAETRRGGEDRDGDGDEIMERQLNFYGGLRWRFEEHVAKEKRKIDRVGLFQAAPGLTLRDNHTLSDEELNTYSCPWHHSLSATICSFRVAKALRSNPGSRQEIDNFRWHKSVQFDWSSMQLMELGLMETGQWF